MNKKKEGRNRNEEVNGKLHQINDDSCNRTTIQTHRNDFSSYGRFWNE